MNRDRAQMTIDYVVGMGIFLLSILFVFQFIYGLFVPYQSGSDEVTLAADRTSSLLIEHILAADRSITLNVMDQGKLYYFINTKMNYSSQTHFEDTEYNKALREVGLFSNDSIFDLNISVAYLNNTIIYQSGPILPENTRIGQTKRIVMIINSSSGYNETAIFSTRVW
jgi:hypothetical protein